jgi:acyl-CoA thioesterase FadM
VTPLPARLVLRREQAIRWSDTDGLGHVWHGVHVALAEEVRTAWLDRVLTDDVGLWQHVVVHVEIDIGAQLRYADRFAVSTCEADGHGRSSVRTRERICTPSGEVVAKLRSVVVAWDPVAGASRALTVSECAALSAQAPSS